jgi:AraC family transcriptional regulator
MHAWESIQKALDYIMIKRAGDDMQWSELFNDAHEPLDSQIKEFVDTPLWDDLANFLQQKYNVQPKLFYSCCSMQKGWNIKYKKSGKSLCTLYPMQGYFIALVVVGAKEMAEADLLIPVCDEYTQELYRQTRLYIGGKWLMMDVTSENVLRDVKNLIALRVGSRK